MFLADIKRAMELLEQIAHDVRAIVTLLRKADRERA